MSLGNPSNTREHQNTARKHIAQGEKQGRGFRSRLGLHQAIIYQYKRKSYLACGVLLDDVLGCVGGLPAASGRVRVEAEKEALSIAVRAAVRLRRVGVLHRKIGHGRANQGGWGQVGLGVERCWCWRFVMVAVGCWCW